ncbi:hypothetical protein ACJIZ3_014563 [Penstemon smallii]|uniref:Uncharacterized protein n=1 Tax=Penstemon smallii TaxID=265156 RepID=A0ABD3RK47_9LAMI
MINNPYTNTRNAFTNKRLIVVNAKRDEQEGKPIDDNMIVLKMRMKKMKVLDTKSNEGAQPISDWKEWEKKLFTHYHEDVCEAIELLRSYLMNTRPSLAIGIMALVAMSVPFSSSVVMVNALKVAKGLLDGCHVCIDIDF